MAFYTFDLHDVMPFYITLLKTSHRSEEQFFPIGLHERKEIQV